jgi:hypothetical protein
MFTEIVALVTWLLHSTARIQAAVIFVLVLLLWRVAVVGAQSRRQCDRARRERDEAKETLLILRRMSEIRVETVTRLRGFAQEP